MTTQQGFPQVTLPFVSQTGQITQTWYQLLISLWNRTGQGSGQNPGLAPTGMITAFGGTVLPDGWIVCDGATVSRTTYSALFAAIGTTWGAGDGSSTFGLPDLRDKTVIGASGTYPLGTTGGASSRTLITANLPAHNHAVIDPGHTHTVTDPGHTHTVTDPGHTHGITDPGHLHTSWAAAANVTTGVNTGGSTTGNTGTSTTSITVNSAVTGVTNAVNTTGVTSASAMTGVSTQNTGTGASFSILPPYAAVQWMIKI
jgi:microcystin-dependent protein